MQVAANCQAEDSLVAILAEAVEEDLEAAVRVVVDAAPVEAVVVIVVGEVDAAAHKAPMDRPGV